MQNELFPTRSVAAVQPTERLHIGNYFGAVKQTLFFQDVVPRNNFCFVADYHAQASTSHWDRIAERTHGLVADFLALGIKPGRTILYRQSDIPEVMEIMWLLSLVTNSAMLERGHKMQAPIPTAAVYLYPLLMAADILGLRATHVPIGEDQKQHQDRAREIATRFNRQVGNSFLPVPVGVYNSSSRVPGTDALDAKYSSDEHKPKMSKSQKNFIPIFCTEEDTEQYVMKITTKSIKWGHPIDPSGDTVFTLYSLMATKDEVNDLAEKMRAGQVGYEDTKRDLAQRINDFFRPARDAKREWMSRPDDIEDILRDGAIIARQEMLSTIEKMRAFTGINQYRRFKVG